MSDELKKEVENKPNGEPRSAWATLPVWIVMLTALLAYRGCIYVDHVGGFQAKLYPPYNELPPELGGGGDEQAKGRKMYTDFCTPCHQANGMGVPGQFPPLGGSDWVNAEGINRIGRIVMNGIQGPIKVNGADYNNVMVPWKDFMKSDEDLAAILTFIRGNFGNKSSPITAADVKAIRAEEMGRGISWTADELLKMPVK
jgi:mono/diheme cytochrome c family protein